jgi:hypothetical protein
LFKRPVHRTGRFAFARGLEILANCGHTARMHKAFVFAALIALSLGVSACSKCDVYRQWTGPQACNGS